jgi:hypothetical protein
MPSTRIHLNCDLHNRSPVDDQWRTATHLIHIAEIRYPVRHPDGREVANQWFRQERRDTWPRTRHRCRRHQRQAQHEYRQLQEVPNNSQPEPAAQSPQNPHSRRNPRALPTAHKMLAARFGAKRDWQEECESRVRGSRFNIGRSKGARPEPDHRPRPLTEPSPTSRNPTTGFRWSIPSGAGSPARDRPENLPGGHLRLRVSAGIRPASPAAVGQVVATPHHTGPSPSITSGKGPPTSGFSTCARILTSWLPTPRYRQD